MKRPDNLIYAVDEWPPLPKLALLGLQQVSLVSIYLVLLVIVLREAGASPAVARNTLSFAMIAMGIGAVLQALWRGPVGSSSRPTGLLIRGLLDDCQVNPVQST